MEDRTQYIEADKLFHKHKSLVEDTIYKIYPNPKLTAKRKGLDLEDLFQYGYTGLWIACTNYDETKGAAFKTHAINNIRWYTIKRVKGECNPMKLSFNVDYVFSEMYKMVSIDSERKAEAEQSMTWHELLPSDTDVAVEAVGDIVMSDCFGMAKHDTESRFMELKLQGYKLTEIADICGCSRQTVRVRLGRMKERIQKYREQAEV